MSKCSWKYILKQISLVQNGILAAEFREYFAIVTNKQISSSPPRMASSKERAININNF